MGSKGVNVKVQLDQSRIDKICQNHASFTLEPTYEPKVQRAGHGAGALLMRGIVFCGQKTGNPLVEVPNV